MLKAILFDLDMTLLDRDRLYDEFSADLLERYLPGGREAENFESEHRRMILEDDHGYGNKQQVYQPLFDVSCTPLNLQDIVSLWADFASDHVHPMEGAKQVLEALSGRYRLGIVTNGRTGPQTSKLKGSGLEPYIETMVVSEEVSIEKPDPGIFLYTLSRMGLKPDEVIYVGDHPVNDVIGAMSAQIRPVYIPSGSGHGENVPDAVVQIDHIRQLPDLIEEIEISEEEVWPDQLVHWYLAHGRILPWRGTSDPYRIWVSEIMLQQTRVETVTRYYDRFIEAFPTVRALAEAPEEEVYKYWEGLGYYKRLKNMLLCAHQIENLYEGRFPERYEQLRKLPGIGDYTAGAISSIAFGNPVPAVDGNVMRVISRLYASEQDILSQGAKKHVTEILSSQIPQGQASAFTQALMDLGAMICVPGHPHCQTCPLLEECKAWMLKKTGSLPVRKKKKKLREENYLLLLIRQQQQVLMVRRREGQVLGGLWGFPLVAEGDEWDFHSLQARDLFTYVHTFTHLRWNLKVLEIRNPDASLIERYRQNDEIIFVDPWKMDQIMVPSAFQKPLEYLRTKQA